MNRGALIVLVLMSCGTLGTFAAEGNWFHKPVSLPRAATPEDAERDISALLHAHPELMTCTKEGEIKVKLPDGLIGTIYRDQAQRLGLQVVQDICDDFKLRYNSAMQELPMARKECENEPEALRGKGWPIEDCARWMAELWNGLSAGPPVIR